MDNQRILKEAQRIAKEFSFWMVSGNIAHLYGHVYKTPEVKYELEIKFEDDFPNTPPQMIYHDEIKKLLGRFKLNNLTNWTPESTVVKIIHELKEKIEETLKTSEKEMIPTKEEEQPEKAYITPDLNAYPPDFQYEEFITPSESEFDSPSGESSSDEPLKKDFIEESETLSVPVNTELGLIQQEYAYDQPGSKGADINVYITITLAKTFVIRIDFTRYPKKPNITFPAELKKILGDPYKALNTLMDWNVHSPSHIIEVLHELEKKLFFIKEIEAQSKKISGEYQCESVSDSLTALKIHLMTYGFKEYDMGVDLEPYPNPPKINLSSELEDILRTQITELKSYKNWKERESEPVEIVREISWLVDKNSRINFEIDLLKDHYKNIRYEPLTSTLLVEMKGKMKTEDLTFEFQIELPNDYPMKMPEVKVVNEFEIEAHEKIKNDLHTSFNDFFKEWTPFSYLVDFFNLISKKIFEVSVVSCVICHKIECPSCSKKIAGEDNCHTECPHCNRAYHSHCWEQTIKSFGKCGFCLR
jgi:ubiquitin-protein ligase